MDGAEELGRGEREGGNAQLHQHHVPEGAARDQSRAHPQKDGKTQEAPHAAQRCEPASVVGDKKAGEYGEERQQRARDEPHHRLCDGRERRLDGRERVGTLVRHVAAGPEERRARDP